MHNRITSSTTTLLSKLNVRNSREEWRRFLSEMFQSLPREDFPIFIGLLIFTALFRPVVAPVPNVPPEDISYDEYLFSINGTGYQFIYRSTISQFKSAIRELKGGACGVDTAEFVKGLGYELIKSWGGSDGQLSRGLNETIYKEQEDCVIREFQDAWDDYQETLKPLLYGIAIVAGVIIVCCVAALIAAVTRRVRNTYAPLPLIGGDMYILDRSTATTDPVFEGYTSSGSEVSLEVSENNCNNNNQQLSDESDGMSDEEELIPKLIEKSPLRSSK